MTLSQIQLRPHPLGQQKVLGHQPCYASHVTRHTSHVTLHTSHVTRHTRPGPSSSCSPHFCCHVFESQVQYSTTSNINGKPAVFIIRHNSNTFSSKTLQICQNTRNSPVSLSEDGNIALLLRALHLQVKLLCWSLFNATRQSTHNLTTLLRLFLRFHFYPPPPPTSFTSHWHLRCQRGTCM